MDRKQFLRIVKRDKEEVKKWPKWKQKITISSKNAQTGRYNEE